MLPLSRVHDGGPGFGRYGRMMRRHSVIATTLLVPLTLGAGWSGPEPRPRLGTAALINAQQVALEAGKPALRRVGALTFLGGVALSSPDPAFGGFSAIAVAGDRFTLVSDGGNLVRFRLGADWQIGDVLFGDLPGGPGSGWEKRQRDAESLAVDPLSGRAWIGFEVGNQIWRYTSTMTRGERGAAPAALVKWSESGGAESLVRLRDGGFLGLSEFPVRGSRGARMGVVWAGDPTLRPSPAFRFNYAPSPGYDPSDATELPDGRLLVLERRFALPFSWSNRLVLIDRAAIRPGATVRGRVVAELAAPLVHDNFEGVTAVREGVDTILWLASDDNHLPIQRTLLLKFRLEATTARASDEKRADRTPKS